MKITKKILAGTAILGMFLSGAVTGAGAASASTVPVVYGDNGWHGYVKPGSIYFGNGGAPFFTQMHWTSWNGTGAWATGKLWTEKFGCSPSYKCPHYSQWVGVYLSTVRAHDGTRYYARMAAEFWYAGKWRWSAGWIENGYWAFPAVFPYL